MQSFSGFHLFEGDRAERGNRMALFEQLTVSPHRFASLSETCRPSSAMMPGLEHSFVEGNQQPSPAFPLPFLPLSDETRSFTCPFFGTTEGTVVCESKSNVSTKGQPIKASTTGQYLDYTTLKSSEELQGSLPSNHLNEVKKEFAASPVSGQDTSVADVMLLVKGAQSLSIGGGLRSASESNEEALCPAAGCIGIGSGSKKAAPIDEMASKALELDPNTSNEEQDKDVKGNFSSKRCSQQEEAFRVGLTPESLEKEIPLDGPVDVQEQDECCSSERCMLTKEGHLDGILHEQEARDLMHCKMNLALAIPGQDAKTLKRTQQSISSTFDVMGTCKAAIGMNCGRFKDSLIGDSIKRDVAETSENDIEMENNLDDLEADCASLISPKAVIQTVGQLRFWKARLALIRQQRIFSDQVFELHKLIEVQQLIAGTPSVPINETYFGVGNMITDCDHDGCSCGFADKAEDPAEALGKQDFTSIEVSIAPVLLGAANPELRDGQSNWPPKAAVVKNGVSAWSDPSLGPPFAGDCTPGPAKSGPFTPAGLGHRRASVGSPPIPYSFPAFSERPQYTPSPHSSYGSVVASAHQQQSVVYGNHSSGYKVSNQIEARTLNVNQCEHEGSTDSVASINKEPFMPLHQMRVACSSMSSDLRRHEKNMESGRKPLRGLFGSEVEDSQHASTGCQLNMSRVRPLDHRDQHPKYNNQHCTGAIDMMQQDFIVERIENFSKEARGSKRQKEREQLDQHREMARGEEMRHGYTSSNPSMSALNLFPLAPTLALDYRGRKRSSTRGKEWQGHVVKVVPRAANSVPDSDAGILLPIQQEKEP